MLKEEFLQVFLSTLYDKEILNIFDYTAEHFATKSEEFLQCSDWTSHLVKEKLAEYADKEHTTLQITNFGRYWIIQGGYDAFLREGLRKTELKKIKDAERERLNKDKEELIEARLKLTHFKLWGFWLSLIISLIGFTLSLFNLYLILKNK